METILRKKIIIFLTVVLFSGISLYHFLGCHMDGRFFFSALDLHLRVIFDVRSDGNMPLWVAHLLHNKLTQGSVDIVNAYISFWDVRFLLFLLSPLTFFGILLWIFYAVKRKIQLSLLEKILIFLCLFIPLPILFHVIKNEKIALLLFSFPLICFSLKGVFYFVTQQKHYWIYLTLWIGISLVALFLTKTTLAEFCHA